MSDWISSDTSRYCAMGTVEQTQSSRGTSLAVLAINTKGGYGELINSSPFDTNGIMVCLSPYNVGSRCLVDIAIGPIGSEQVIVNNLHIDNVINDQISVSFCFPVAIPGQTRIAARMQSSSASAKLAIAGHLLSSGFADVSPLGKVTTYGVDMSDSGGTQIDPGAIAGVKGAWAQIVSNTTSPITKLAIVIGGDTNSIRANSSWLLDIGIGSSGSETVLINNLPLVFHENYIFPKIIGPMSVSIPTATRIAVRAQSTNVDATDRLFDIALYGVS